MYRQVTTKAELQSLAVRSGVIVDCREVKTSYKFFQNSPGYTVNGITVIQSSVYPSGRWVGIAGRNVYDPTADSNGSVKSNGSNRQINYTATTAQEVVNRQSIEGEVVYCRELKTSFQFFSNFPFIPIDNTTVLSSTVSSSARWVGVSGNYVYTSVQNYTTGAGSGSVTISEPLPVAPPLNVVISNSVSSQLQNPILVFYQDFPKGAGYSNSYTLTGVDNAVLSTAFNPAQIVTIKPVTVVFPDGKPVYDNLFPRTQAHRISAIVNLSGQVTLSSTPYSGYTQDIRIYFFYSLTSNETVYSYTRDDIVSDIEASNNLFATDVQVENALSLFPGSVLNIEQALNHLQTQINSLGGTIATREKFTTAPGQTVFNLTNTPISIFDGFEVEYNGTELVEGDDFTVAGNVVTLSAGWSTLIQAGDKIVISYKY